MAKYRITFETEGPEHGAVPDRREESGHTYPKDTPVSDPSTFRKQLEHLINSQSREQVSDTPDFILAEYLENCLDAYDRAVQRREEWYGRTKETGPIDLAAGPVADV